LGCPSTTKEHYQKTLRVAKLLLHQLAAEIESGKIEFAAYTARRVMMLLVTRFHSIFPQRKA
jgi:hypothetical protein